MFAYTACQAPQLALARHSRLRVFRNSSPDPIDPPPPSRARRQLRGCNRPECNHPPCGCAGSSSRLRVRGARTVLSGSAFLYSKTLYYNSNSKHYIDENKVTRCRSVRAPDPARAVLPIVHTSVPQIEAQRAPKAKYMHGYSRSRSAVPAEAREHLGRAYGDQHVGEHLVRPG